MTAKKSIAVLLAVICILLCCGCKAQTEPPAASYAGYWYYDHLSEDQKSIYTKALQAAENMQMGLIKLGEYGGEDVTLACRAVLSDRPDFFWLPEGFIFEEDGENAYIGFEYKTNAYLMPSEQMRNAESLLNSAIVEINKGIADGMSDFDKELYYHNWLCDNVIYADNTDNSMVYTAYGALVNGSAVCEGYARAMQLLCQSQNIDCHVVYGSAQSARNNYVGHMWNQIKLDGKYYNLDVTLDDAGDTASFDFFNLTDKQLEVTHAFDRDFTLLTAAEKESGNVSFNLNLPACTAEKYNYYSVFPKEQNS